jgi:hypothetical protein
MRFKLFQYPLPAPEELTDLNAFLASHRVVHVQHQVVPKGEGSESLFANARTADDTAWRQTVVQFSRVRDVQGPEPRDARGLLEQRRGQVPLAVSQQEEARQPEQQPWLPGLSGPQRGGNPPDNARSSAHGDGPGPKPESPGGRRHPKQAYGRKAEEKAPAGQLGLFADL